MSDFETLKSGYCLSRSLRSSRGSPNTTARPSFPVFKTKQGRQRQEEVNHTERRERPDRVGRPGNSRGCTALSRATHDNSESRARIPNRQRGVGFAPWMHFRQPLPLACARARERAENQGGLQTLPFLHPHPPPPLSSARGPGALIRLAFFFLLLGLQLGILSKARLSLAAGHPSPGSVKPIWSDRGPRRLRIRTSVIVMGP